MMKGRMIIALGAMALLTVGSVVVRAEDAPPTYKADPDVYKVIFEDANFRVIAANWKAGATDKSHSHPVPSVAYSLTDCALQLTNPDGKTVDLHPKAGAANAVPITAAHTARNVGTSDCQTLFVERK
jgi:hypothetical protein